jgi:hypothetical protein
MKSILQILTLKRSLILSAVVLGFLIIFNFYGPYTNKFYFFKVSNYILPVLAIVHFTFLYVLWFKTTEHEETDLPMRNLEYALYGLLLVYAYKTFESIYVLSTYSDYESHVMPGLFLPLGVLILILYVVLISLTLILIKYRKEHVGEYKFDDMDHIDSWE